jgi:hypothetical protein
MCSTLFVVVIRTTYYYANTKKALLAGTFMRLRAASTAPSVSPCACVCTRVSSPSAMIMRGCRALPAYFMQQDFALYAQNRTEMSSFGWLRSPDTKQKSTRKRRCIIGWYSLRQGIGKLSAGRARRGQSAVVISAAAESELARTRLHQR